MELFIQYWPAPAGFILSSRPVTSSFLFIIISFYSFSLRFQSLLSHSLGEHRYFIQIVKIVILFFLSSMPVTSCSTLRVNVGHALICMSECLCVCVCVCLFLSLSLSEPVNIGHELTRIRCKLEQGSFRTPFDLHSEVLKILFFLFFSLSSS